MVEKINLSEVIEMIKELLEDFDRGTYLVGIDVNGLNPAVSYNTQIVRSKSRSILRSRAIALKNNSMNDIVSVYAVPYIRFTQKMSEMGVREFSNYIINNFEKII